ncbi:MAG: amidohydrolase family protein [bacterium]|nr:amidohydrolase family protein [bacterium]MDE0289050.1 amidohydrolase family protein [bacterium]MDE0436990.1 amidohydrolase family protein [bacterium]
MASYELVIKNGVLVGSRADPRRADLAADRGRIVAIEEPGRLGPGVRTIDAGGLYVMPGAIDPHVHLGMGGGFGSFQADTGSAAIGGVSSLFTILIDSGPYEPLIAEHREVLDRVSHVDFGFHLTLMTDEHVDALAGLAERWGVNSYKYYMSFRGDEGAYLGIEGTDDGAFHSILTGVAAVDGVLQIHPENIEVVWRLRDKVRASGRDDLRAWDESRPAFVEAESIWRASFFADLVGARVYFVHLSSAHALAAVRGARAAFPGSTLLAETCPHYLTHTHDSELGVVGKINPPLRGDDDVSAVWEAVGDGTMDTVGSDHVGRRLEMKRGSIWTASAGFPGLPTVLPVLLSEGHHRRGLPLPEIARLAARRPAEIFGCADRKGDLRVGMDADLAIVDLDWTREVDSSMLGTWADYSIYDGWSLTGWPRYTVVRGVVVQENGDLVGPPGWGQHIRRG